jgi:hypothetical protein
MTDTTQEPKLEIVTLQLCSSCLDGNGGICHVPGCALCRSTAPDIPIRESAIPRPSPDVAGVVEKIIAWLLDDEPESANGIQRGKFLSIARARMWSDELEGKS